MDGQNRVSQTNGIDRASERLDLIFVLWDLRDKEEEGIEQ
jgi:hypothetical protein